MSYYNKFFFFFNDVNDQNFADLVFVRKVLSRLDCIIFTNDTKIIEPGKLLYNLYFLYKGSVTIVDSSFTFQIARLQEESFFGDFQLLLGTLSEFYYVASGDRHTADTPTWCMTLRAKSFNEICDQFPVTRAFLTVRAI